MPVPYLDHKPEALHVGIGRQLFVDDYLIAETNLIPVLHFPDLYGGNPVLEPEQVWEAKGGGGSYYCAPFSDGVWYDEGTFG